MSPKKRKRRPLGETVGGMLVGFDYQVFRATKPPPELIESAKPIPPVPAAGGGTLDVEVPALEPPSRSERPSRAEPPEDAEPAT
jgi:hypothetical protein